MAKEEAMQFFRLVLLTIITFVVLQDGIACSGYKITIGNRTFLGSNHDAWFTTPHIWFENAGNGKYGAAFTGARFDGANGYAPQSGMNEMGLAFERLASYHPVREKFENRSAITNPTKYLKDILHSCKTVEEVKAYISNYDHSYFIEDVFIYVDKAGKYLIVEPYTLKLADDPSYVIANFCPSITPLKEATKLERYRKGLAFVQEGIDTTLEYGAALLETMHVRRQKIGDGTLLSSIWDLSKGTVNLYFYHDFTKTVQFNIREELSKGDHMIAVETLFPQNLEFEKLQNYKTPKNSSLIAVFVIACAGFFLMTALFFLVQFFILNEQRKYRFMQLILSLVGFILFGYMIVLSGSVRVFYFPAPYQDPANVFISLSSYVPFLVLCVVLPSLVVNYRLLKRNSWGGLNLGLLTLSNLIYIMLIALFGYWRFYDVFR